MFASIKSKMLFLALGIVVVFAVIFISFYINNAKSIEAVSVENELILREQNKSRIKDMSLQMAHTLGELLKGVSSEEKQIEIIKKMVDDFRFEADKSGYFYIYI